MRHVVPVDEGDREPVVGGALGHREGQHHDADEQGPRLEPGAGGRGPTRLLDLRHRQERGRAAPDHGGRDDDHEDEVRRTRHVERDQAGTAQRPDDRAEAEAGVEARHHGATEAALHLGALDVHGHVPHADADAVEQQRDAGDDQRVTECEPGGAEPERGHDGTGAQHPDGAPPPDRGAGRRQGHERADGDHEEENAQPAVAQPEPVARLRDAGHPAGEAESVEDEGQPDGVAGGDELGHERTPGRNVSIESIRRYPLRHGRTKSHPDPRGRRECRRRVPVHGVARLLRQQTGLRVHPTARPRRGHRPRLHRPQPDRPAPAPGPQRRRRHRARPDQHGLPRPGRPADARSRLRGARRRRPRAAAHGRPRRPRAAAAPPRRHRLQHLRARVLAGVRRLRGARGPDRGGRGARLAGRDVRRRREPHRFRAARPAPGRPRPRAGRHPHPGAVPPPARATGRPARGLPGGRGDRGVPQRHRLGPAARRRLPGRRTRT